MAKEAYHHTPLFAAVDFARTATPALRGKKDVHKLSRSALQPSKKAGGALSPLQFVQQQERAQLRMEATAERNQFQLTKVLEDALVSDKARNINKRQQRDFKNALLAPKARSTKLRDPPTSPEDAIHSDPSNLDRGTSSKHQRALLPSDRHDWAQRDEGREVRMHGLEGEKIALPQCRDKEQESSSSKIQQAERDPAPEIPGDGIVARPIPYRQSHIKLRTLFKRQ